MHALADWMAELVQILCCIKIDICIMCSIVDQAGTVVHSSGPFGGSFFVWGGSSKPREPPGYRTALVASYTEHPQVEKITVTLR